MQNQTHRHTHLESRRRMLQNPPTSLISRHIPPRLASCHNPSLTLPKSNKLTMTMYCITFVVRCMDAVSPYCIAAFDPHTCTPGPAAEEFLAFFAREESLENCGRVFFSWCSCGTGRRYGRWRTVCSSGVHLDCVFHFAREEGCYGFWLQPLIETRDS